MEMDFHDAWWWLHGHPAFFHQPPLEMIEGFFDNLDVEVHRVNPNTGQIDGNRALNTKTEIWLEAGPWGNPEKDLPPDVAKEWIKDKGGEFRTHDTRLDCGGNTYEEAIIKMAKLVKEHYGDYTPEE